MYKKSNFFAIRNPCAKRLRGLEVYLGYLLNWITDSVFFVSLRPLNIYIDIYILQCTRQKAGVSEDLGRSQEDNSRLSDFNGKLAKEKEELAKEKANLIVQLTATERENRTLSEEIAGLK